MGVVESTVQDGGRLVIPAELQQKLGLQTGTEVFMDVVAGAVRIRTMEQIVKDVQARMRRCVPEGVSLVDELIADRRAEAAREELD
jgi:bifunctional DNA-binding transcriptional regulator/antitoxin component of YhaV-PrlF toxin-antitoxin module